MRRQAIVLAAALAMAPLGAQAADLVVWWEKGFYRAGGRGGQRRSSPPSSRRPASRSSSSSPPRTRCSTRSKRRSRPGSRPTSCSALVGDLGRPSGLTRTGSSTSRTPLAQSLDLFDADAIEASTLLNGRTGQRGLYALPMGRHSNHVHVWNSLLERAGFTLADIPEGVGGVLVVLVRPGAAGGASGPLGRDDIWGVGLPMSAGGSTPTTSSMQFQLAYEAPWLDRDRRPQVDDPAVRAGMIKALEAYTAIWRKGCTPPDSVNWTNIDNNKAFLAQTVVMTPNPSNERSRSRLRCARRGPTTTTRTPRPSTGRTAPMASRSSSMACSSRAPWSSRPAGIRRSPATSSASWPRKAGSPIGSTFAGDRLLPPMRKLVEQPFWLDPSDPHRMRAAIQILTRPHHDTTTGRSGPRMAVGPDIRGERLGQRRPPRRRRGHQPRAGGRRGDRPDQADPERVVDVIRLDGAASAPARGISRPASGRPATGRRAYRGRRITPPAGGAARRCAVSSRRRTSAGGT